jgi:hypothetical protein
MSQRTAVPSTSDSCSVNTVNILPGLLDSAHEGTVILPNTGNPTTTKLWFNVCLAVHRGLSGEENQLDATQ